VNLLVALHAACPPGLRVLSAPLDVILAEDTGVQPDLLVAPRADFTEKNLPGPPLLAVEVLSPSTRSIDLLLKRERYERAGVPSYWVVDPVEPSLTAWELRDGSYEQVVQVVGTQSWTPTTPYSLTIVPSRLLD
jgi:Uma2 family endonuclease